MKQDTETKKTEIYRWLKRVVAVGMVSLWFALLVYIFRSGGTFADQAPKCIFTTMIVFGILTALYKGIETLEKRHEDEKPR